MEAKIKMFKGREEAVITKVIERRKLPISGVLQMGKWQNFDLWFQEMLTSQKIFLFQENFCMKLKIWDMVAVEVTGWNGKNPEGEIKEVFWDPNARWVDILSIASEYGARMWWSEEIKSELKSFLTHPWEEKENIKGIKLTKEKIWEICLLLLSMVLIVRILTMLFLSKVGNNYKLYVHIADVAHYVVENKAIDKEARARGTSIYLVDKVIPMLPEELSNGLCSLNPHEPKLSMTCEITLNSAGHIKDSTVYESIIQSDFRMTYKEVDQILLSSSSPAGEGARGWGSDDDLSSLTTWDDLIFGGSVSDELMNMLQNFTWITRNTHEIQKESMILEFHFPEPKIE